MHVLTHVMLSWTVFVRMSPGLGVLVSPGWRPYTGIAEFDICTSSPFLELDRLFFRVLCITELPPAMCERNHFVCVLFSFTYASK